jgi:hypothetical protein
MTRIVATAAAIVAGVGVLASCGAATEHPTMRSIVETVPLRLEGGQSVTISLPARTPSTGTCGAKGADAAATTGDLHISVPPVAPAALTGAKRIVRGTTATYVAEPDGTATSYFERTVATGPETDVAAFLGTALGRKSSVGASPVMTTITAALDEHGVYAAVLLSRPGPIDVAGPNPSMPDWVASGAAPGGRLVVVAGYRADQSGPPPTPSWATAVTDFHAIRDGRIVLYTATTTDPCRYETAAASLVG